MKRTLVFAMSVLGACGSAGRRGGNGDGGTDLGPGDDLESAQHDFALPLSAQFVYAHTYSDLYRLDPETSAIVKVASFGWPLGGTDMMTDLAIDKNGNMTGVSFKAIYAVDPDTAGCTLLSHFTGSFINGLSYLPIDGDAEALVGTATNGDLFRIDPATGSTFKFGNFGGGLASSGDIMFVSGLGTYATVKVSGVATDSLARIDPMTGGATLVGDTGFSNLWGLGFWKDKLYGFTSDGKTLSISPMTGAAQLLHTDTVSWYGAGVRTSAPVIQ